MHNKTKKVCKGEIYKMKNIKLMFDIVYKEIENLDYEYERIQYKFIENLYSKEEVEKKLEINRGKKEVLLKIIDNYGIQGGEFIRGMLK